MEHVVQVGIGIDDDAIRKAVENAAINQVVKHIVARVVTDNNYYANGKFTPYGEELIKKALDAYKDDIIEYAVAAVIRTIKNTKKFRNAIDSIVAAMIEESSDIPYGAVVGLDENDEEDDVGESDSVS